MINKLIKKTIQLVLLGTSFLTFSNTFANQYIIGDDELEKAKTVLNGFGDIFYNIVFSDNDFRQYYQEVRMTGLSSGPIKQVVLSSNRSDKFDMVMFINPAGSDNTSFPFRNQTAIIAKFSNIEAVPLMLRGKIIALVAKHLNFGDSEAPAKLGADDFKCFTNIDGLKKIADFTGENVASIEKVNFLKFSKFGKDEMRMLDDCEGAKFNKFTITETSGPRLMQNKTIDIQIMSDDGSSGTGGTGGSGDNGGGNSGGTGGTGGSGDNGNGNSGNNGGGKGNDDKGGKGNDDKGGKDKDK